jgi:FkbM family methyltransferase
MESTACHHLDAMQGEELAREWLSADSNARRFVLGRNDEALNCLLRMHVDGVVDDFAPASMVWNGVPIVRSSALPQDAIVVNCSTSIRPVSAHRKLCELRGVKAFWYCDLARIDSDIPPAAFVADFRADFVVNEPRWHALAARLADDESRRVLGSLMSFRRTGDARYMAGFTVRFDEQYFDRIAKLSDHEVFVDCGGYDGDTTLQFLSRVAGYKRIYVFEPSPTNFAKAAKCLARKPDIVLKPIGVSDKAGTLPFDPGLGSASAVGRSGAVSIEVAPIDEAILEPVTFIKMDLEGWELRALEGARRHICEDHPKLAVAVYHRASDFWQVPDLVLSMRDDFALHIRHYSEGWSETVMYFVPRAS